MSGAATSGPLALQAVYQDLLQHFGPRSWWPAEHWFEVMVGAVLTQNTAWVNVEKALASMRAQGLLVPQAVLQAEPEALAEAIRSAGYYNLKARRLRNLTQVLQADGGLAGWAAMETWPLRERLLGINGVGEETADSILLYVFQRPVFVVDAYTRRIFSRLGLIRGDERYRDIAQQFEHALGPVEPTFNEYHALIVALGNRLCRPRPLCAQCPLGDRCGWNESVTPEKKSAV